MSVDFTCDEKDRFSSRLATIPGIRPMPSVGDWILLEVAEVSFNDNLAIPENQETVDVLRFNDVVERHTCAIQFE